MRPGWKLLGDSAVTFELLLACRVEPKDALLAAIVAMPAEDDIVADAWLALAEKAVP